MGWRGHSRADGISVDLRPIKSIDERSEALPDCDGERRALSRATSGYHRPCSGSVLGHGVAGIISEAKLPTSARCGASLEPGATLVNYHLPPLPDAERLSVSAGRGVAQAAPIAPSLGSVLGRGVAGIISARLFAAPKNLIGRAVAR
jgi:hypothetical protein